MIFCKYLFTFDLLKFIFMLLGKKLYKLRNGKNLTKEGLANVLGVSKVAYGKWENDITKPSFDNINLLCNFFNISKDELIEDEKVNLQNNVFTNSPNIINSSNTTVTYSFPKEVIEKLLENQQNITKAVELQKKLFEKYIKK